MSIFKQ